MACDAVTRQHAAPTSPGTYVADATCDYDDIDGWWRAELTARCGVGRIPRSDLRGLHAADWTIGHPFRPIHRG